MEFEETPPKTTQEPALPDANQEAAPPKQPSPEELRKQRQIVFGIVAGVVIFLALIVLFILWLRGDAARTSNVRDIFIIFMALETLVIGLVLVILVVQLARLINLLQNEIKPILNSTNETVSTLRGTVMFLSDNLAEPVMKLNEYLAAMGQLRETLGFFKRKDNTNN